MRLVPNPCCTMLSAEGDTQDKQTALVPDGNKSYLVRVFQLLFFFFNQKLL